MVKGEIGQEPDRLTGAGRRSQEKERKWGDQAIAGEVMRRTESVGSGGRGLQRGKGTPLEGWKIRKMSWSTGC